MESADNAELMRKGPGRNEKNGQGRAETVKPIRTVIDNERIDAIAHSGDPGAEEQTVTIQAEATREQTTTAGDLVPEEIDDWSSCETSERETVTSKENIEKVLSSTQRALRSKSGKQQEGKSVFGGKTLLFNIQSGAGPTFRGQKGRKWTTLSKNMANKKNPKNTDITVERADKRRKRSIYEDTTDLGECLIPNRESVSAGIAQMITQRHTFLKERQLTEGTDSYAEKDTEMREDTQENDHGEKKSGAPTPLTEVVQNHGPIAIEDNHEQNPNITTGEANDQYKMGQLELVELALSKYKGTLKCTHCRAEGSLKKNGNTQYKGKVIKCAVCSKQASGNIITEMLNSQIGPHWEQEVANKNSGQLTPPNINSGDLTSRNRQTKEAETITIPRTVWDAMQRAIKDLQQNQDSMASEIATLKKKRDYTGNNGRQATATKNGQYETTREPAHMAKRNTKS